MPSTKPHQVITSTGAVVTLFWSNMGHAAQRKHRWGTIARKRWGAIRLHGDSWHLPKSVTKIEVEELFAEILRASDRAVVVFPHGSTRGASAMRVHAYNCGDLDQ